MSSSRTALRAQSGATPAPFLRHTFCDFFTQPGDVIPLSRNGHPMLPATGERVNTLYVGHRHEQFMADQARFVGPWVWRYVKFPLSQVPPRQGLFTLSGGVPWAMLPDSSHAPTPQCGIWSFSFALGLHQ